MIMRKASEKSATKRKPGAQFQAKTMNGAPPEGRQKRYHGEHRNGMEAIAKAEEAPKEFESKTAPDPWQALEMRTCRAGAMALSLDSQSDAKDHMGDHRCFLSSVYAHARAPSLATGIYMGEGLL